MALNLFQKIMNKLLREFQLANGRSPMNPKEMMDIQNKAVDMLNKSKGAPSIKKEFQGWTPKVIQGGKPKKGIKDLIETGEITIGRAPKTKLKPVGPDDPVIQQDVIKEEWIAKKKRENKEAIERFKEKTKTVEDFTKEGDWDPSGFAGGGIAPLVGQPTYAADFYDNREPFIFGGSTGFRKLLQRLRKGRPDQKAFPKLKDKRGNIIEEQMKVLDPQSFERIQELKVKYLEGLVDALRADKDLMLSINQNKAKGDQGLDFLMKYMEKEFAPHLKYYTDIDKDILRAEQMVANKMKKQGRKPHADGGEAQISPQQIFEKVMMEGYTPTPEEKRLLDIYLQSMENKAEGGRAGFHGGGHVGLPPYTTGIGSQMPGYQQQMGVIMGHGPSITEREQQGMAQNPYMTKADQPQAQGQGIMGQGPRAAMAGGGMGRRAFLKLLASLGALPFLGKGIQKTAPKAIKEVGEIITRDADGIPTYAFDLIEVVKAKGTKEIMEGLYKRNPPQTKYTYKDVEVVEDGLGNVSVKKPQTKTGSWSSDELDDVIVDDYVDREVGFEIRKGEVHVKDEGLETQKAIEGPDEYTESTAYMQADPDGGMDVAEIAEQIDIEDHLDLKEIADEIKDLPIKKASGGLAYMLGE